MGSQKGAVRGPQEQHFGQESPVVVQPEQSTVQVTAMRVLSKHRETPEGIP